MFKDYDKYLSASLKVYLFVLVCVLILKLVGLDYFGLDLTNPTVVKVDIFLHHTKIIYALDFLTLYLMFYFYISMVCDRKDMKIVSLISSAINIVIQLILLKIDLYNYYSIISISYMIILPSIISRKNLLVKSVKYAILITIYQLLSLFIRSATATELYNLKTIDMILNIDQLLLLLITYKVHFENKEVKKCLLEVGLFSQMKANLKNLPKKLQTNLHNFKKKSKQERLAISIYIFFSLHITAINISSIACN